MKVPQPKPGNCREAQLNSGCIPWGLLLKESSLCTRFFYHSQGCHFSSEEEEGMDALHHPQALREALISPQRCSPKGFLGFL